MNMCHCQLVVQKVYIYKKLLSEFDLDILCKPITINVNNHSTIKLAENSLFHSKIKNIDMRHDFIWFILVEGKVAVKHVPASEMGADILTKPVVLKSTMNVSKLWMLQISVCYNMFCCFIV